MSYLGVSLDYGSQAFHWKVFFDRSEYGHLSGIGVSSNHVRGTIQYNNTCGRASAPNSLTYLATSSSISLLSPTPFLLNQHNIPLVQRSNNHTPNAQRNQSRARQVQHAPPIDHRMRCLFLCDPSLHCLVLERSRRQLVHARFKSLVQRRDEEQREGHDAGDQ